MPRYRTALGVDISDGRINLALLKKQGDSVKLLKAACCPVPDGAIKNGNIEDAAVLARAIKKLKSRNGIRVHPTAVSLVARPTLMQILDLPKEAPGNVRQFVFNEVKHYAMLPIKKAVVDFCGIRSLSGSGGRRAFVVATDGQKVNAALKVFNRQGLNIEAVEPSWMAYTRACYAKNIADKANTNILIATVFDGTLTLSLFKDNTLDFIRVKPAELRPEEYFGWLEGEIGEVLKFCEVRTPKKNNKWRVILVTDIPDGSAGIKAEELKSRFEDIEFHMTTPSNAFLDTPVANDSFNNEPSAVAVGLAMGLLNTPCAGFSINLLPSEVALAKSREKKILVAANIAAILFVLMILSSAFVNARMEKTDKAIRQKQQLQTGEGTQALLNEQSLLQEQITEISSKLEQIDSTLETDTVWEWGQILNGIRLATPETVRITKLDSSDNSKILLSGQAVSYPAVNLFIEALNKCGNINSASLVGSRNNIQPGGLVEYSISCLLTQ
ncbi:MAG: pilus assembly protein PilM [Sedimentisphaerales bacterium]|nr:pilus assembly protein PilM [Sedimentisphaerales bacterium]